MNIGQPSSLTHGKKPTPLLAALASGSESPEVFQGASRPNPVVAWQFTGQGSQYLGMGRSLYESEPVFREWMDRFADELALYRRGNLCEIIFENEALLTTTTWTQPALFFNATRPRGAVEKLGTQSRILSWDTALVNTRLHLSPECSGGKTGFD